MGRPFRTVPPETYINARQTPAVGQIRTFRCQDAVLGGANAVCLLFIALIKESFMIRRLLLAAVAALSLSLMSNVPVSAATATAAPMMKDASGKCHDASGKFTKCAPAMSSMKGVTKDKSGKCHDASGKFTKCPPTAKAKM